MRREFIVKSILGAAGLLAGCAQSKDPAFPATVGAKKGVWIDAHAHIFNAEDLDTFGYVEHGEGDSAVKRYAFTLLSPLLKTLCATIHRIAPGIQRESWLLDRMIEKRQRKMQERQTDGRRDPRKLAQSLIADIHEIDPLHQQQVQQLDRELQRCLHGNEIKVDPDNNPLRRVMPWLARQIAPSFISCLANYRIYNALKLIANYPDVDAFVVANLDTDLWYRFYGPTYKLGEKMMQQAQVMSKIAILTEGRILPRTGFCPLRQALSVYAPDQSVASPLEVVKCAVHHFGSIGAKLYPVVGYRPLGNRFMTNRELSELPMVDIQKALRDKPEWAGAAAKLKSDTDFTIGEEIDRALRQLYDTCVEHGISVMAHTNRSWGPTSFMNRVAPGWWKQLAEAYPKLRVNLAHFCGFGNGRNAYADLKKAEQYGPGVGWPEEAARDLFRKEFPHVYADFSCITPTKTVESDFVGLLQDHPLAGRRLMYGSDWHEVLFPGGAPNYLNDWTKMFAPGRPLAPHAADFLGGNAVRFHGLAEGQVRDRLKEFYGKNGVKPGWWDKVRA